MFFYLTVLWQTFSKFKWLLTNSTLEQHNSVCWKLTHFGWLLEISVYGFQMTPAWSTDLSGLEADNSSEHELVNSHYHSFTAVKRKPKSQSSEARAHPMPWSSLTQKPWWCLSTGSGPLWCAAENRTSLDRKGLKATTDQEYDVTAVAGTHSVSGARTNQLLKPAGDSPSFWYKTEIEL